ncbi:hypothetical protein JTB14_006754 [Gonioctena quinquepunctata]|nr:hypothetical protein JTB14_006754 [Gonioctena quinquepunctata]
MGQDQKTIDDVLRDYRITKRAKGVKEFSPHRNIMIEDFVDCVENCITKNVEQKLFRSEKYIVSSIIQTKIAPNPHDDKRYLTHMEHCLEVING